MDRGAWWATLQGIAKSWTWLKRLNTHTQEVNKGSCCWSYIRVGSQEKINPGPACILSHFTILSLFFHQVFSSQQEELLRVFGDQDGGAQGYWVHAPLWTHQNYSYQERDSLATSCKEERSIQILLENKEKESAWGKEKWRRISQARSSSQGSEGFKALIRHPIPGVRHEEDKTS